MDSRPPVLTAEGVAVARGRRRLLDGIDVALRRGEVTVIIGPNGVGKSTLLSVLGGLLAPAAGTITRNGRIAAALQAPALARRSVAANLDLALSWWGVPRAQRGERAAAALDLLHITDLAGRMADTLSGGEARRVHLARALALGSDALLLDEPFAGLDPPTRAELLSDASTALRSPDRATLVVVHDRAEAWALADRLIVLLDGRIAAQGAPAEVLEHPDEDGVARFLGFTGTIAQPDGSVLHVRPAQVVLDPDGPLRGLVQRRVPEEDGVLCEIALPDGQLQVRSPYPGPEVGDVVAVRVAGGASFPGGAPSTT